VNVSLKYVLMVSVLAVCGLCQLSSAWQASEFNWANIVSSATGSRQSQNKTVSGCKTSANRLQNKIIQIIYIGLKLFAKSEVSLSFGLKPDFSSGLSFGLIF